MLEGGSEDDPNNDDGRGCVQKSTSRMTTERNLVSHNDEPADEQQLSEIVSQTKLGRSMTRQPDRESQPSRVHTEQEQGSLLLSRSLTTKDQARLREER